MALWKKTTKKTSSTETDKKVEKETEASIPEEKKGETKKTSASKKLLTAEGFKRRAAKS